MQGISEPRPSRVTGTALMQGGQRIAVAGMAVSGALALLKILVGMAGHSAAVVADGLESVGDVFASGFVVLGLGLAAKPADHDHPYGHGRVEILTGLWVGLLLVAGGVLISYVSFDRLHQARPPLAAWVFWPLIVSLVAKAAVAVWKYGYAIRIGSAALKADAWHDATDSFSAVVALGAVGLTLLDPRRFLDFDCYGGVVVGLLVILAGVRVVYETALQLMDTMPDDRLMNEVRGVASAVPGVRGVEKCYARKTGLRYHVDLHLEVDPEMTVRQSHQIAHEVRLAVIQHLEWVADVLVHVEPAP